MPTRSRSKSAVIVIVVAGVAIGISIILFTLFFRTNDSIPYGPTVSTVVFALDGSLPDAPDNGVNPREITVVIGFNNTVRWINNDTIPHRFPTPDDEGQTDPLFFKALQSAMEQKAFLMPGKTFEYTLTVPGRIDYHMVPHPQMKGAVIVLPLPTS